LLKKGHGSMTGPPPGQPGQRTGPAPDHGPRQWPMARPDTGPGRPEPAHNGPGWARYRAILPGLGPSHGSRAKWPTIVAATLHNLFFPTF
jgi:hypothetical protein